MKYNQPKVNAWVGGILLGIFALIGILGLAQFAFAQVVPAQNQVTSPPFGGLVYATSSTATAKLYQLLGNSFGQLTYWTGTKWDLIATSSLGITGTTYTATYPITLSGNAFGIAFGTTTANTWNLLQTFTSGFISNSSSTITSGLFSANGGASTTALSVGTGTFIQSAATSTFGAGISGTILNLTSTSATSTFANGVVFSGGCVLVGGVCLTSNTGTVTSITGGLGLNGGTITTSGTLSLKSYIATSSAETAWQLPVWTSTGGTPALLGSVATTSVTCSGGTSCSSFVTIGGTPITISSTAVTSQDPFTHVSVYGQTTSATSTLIALTGSPFSLVASSTVNFVNASTSLLTLFNTNNALLGTNSGGLVIATTTPTALAFNATSATATSTFAGNVAITGNLQVSGNFYAPVTLTAGGNLNMNSNSITNVAGLTGTFITAIVNGGTATSTGGNTNGVEYYNGTVITNSNQLLFNGTNLSIATTTFGSLLNLGGIANFTTATSSFYGSGGFNIASGCYAVNGTCLTSSTSFGWPWTIVTNFGTTTNSTTTPAWFKTGVYASSTSQFVNATTSQFTHLGTTWFPIGIWNSAGAVGIGTTSPSTLLHISGGQAAITASGQSAMYFTPANGSINQGFYLGRSIAGDNAQNFFLYDLTAAVFRMFVGSTGSVGIGNTNPQEKLDVTGSIRASGGYLYTTDGVNGLIGALNGNLYVRASSGGAAVVFDTGAVYAVLPNLDGAPVCLTGSQQLGYNTVCSSSDARMKENIKELSIDEGLAAIDKLRPVSFTWKDVTRQKMEGLSLGFLAQDVQKVIPEIVSQHGTSSTITLKDGTKETIDKPLALDYAKITVSLVKAVQQLHTDLQNLLARLDGNEKRLDDLEQRVAALEAAK